MRKVGGLKALRQSQEDRMNKLRQLKGIQVGETPEAYNREYRRKNKVKVTYGPLPPVTHINIWGHHIFYDGNWRSADYDDAAAVKKALEFQPGSGYVNAPPEDIQPKDTRTESEKWADDWEERNR